MNNDTLQGQWTQLKGRVRQQWGKLTDDDLDKIQGNLEELHGRLQERYGRAKEDIHKEVDAWLSQQKESSPASPGSLRSAKRKVKQALSK